MHYSICSYSFHRTVAAGEMDIFSYITWNKENGFTQLDPWMKHLEAGYDDAAFLDKVKAAAAAVDLSFDTYNWAPGTAEAAWPKCVQYARLTHVKTFEFDADGNDPTVNVAKAMHILQEVGYDGTLGFESLPTTATRSAVR